MSNRKEWNWGDFTGYTEMTYKDLVHAVCNVEYGPSTATFDEFIVVGFNEIGVSDNEDEELYGPKQIVAAEAHNLYKAIRMLQQTYEEAMSQTSAQQRREIEAEIIANMSIDEWENG